MYSLPIRATFAALTIASAASIEPMRPLVSTIPSASPGMNVGRTLARFARYYADNDVQCIQSYTGPVAPGRRGGSLLSRRGQHGAGRHTDGDGEQARCSHRQPGPNDIPVRCGPQPACLHRRLLALRALPRWRPRADVDRRSRIADTDAAVEAGGDDRILPYDVHSKVPVRRRDDGRDRSLFTEEWRSAPSSGPDRRPAVVSRRLVRHASRKRPAGRGVQRWVVRN